MRCHARLKTVARQEWWEIAQNVIKLLYFCVFFLLCLFACLNKVTTCLVNTEILDIYRNYTKIENKFLGFNYWKYWFGFGSE